MSDFLFRQDTIAAIATPVGRGAIGIIRLSGPAILEVLSPIWRGKSLEVKKPRTFSLGNLVDSNGTLLDQALLVHFIAPNSYTGEDMAELHCHGNPSLLGDILRLLVARGVRPAEPGEFTFRAFRNGKISLFQAESVAELIEARGQWARQNALRVLAEKGDSWVQEALDRLLEIWVRVEADLEFPTDDLDSLHSSDLLPGLESLHRDLDGLRKRSVLYSKLQEGYRVVLAGPPNVGKSSLLNALLGYNRALVTDIPGTTRDTLEESFEAAGIPIRLVDTAGLGESQDVLDLKGMERSRDALSKADLVLAVVDVSDSQPNLDESLFIRWLPKATEAPECPVLLVGNKGDLLPQGSPWFNLDSLILVSAKEETGLEHLTEKMGEVLRQSGGMDLEERIMLNQRQENTLAQAIESIERGIHNVQQRAHQELVATDLSDARKALEELSGNTLHLDLLGTIFSRFCIGK
jgi:tRNA modification GTPase